MGVRKEEAYSSGKKEKGRLLAFLFYKLYRIYVIQQGDSLAELSQTHLGDALRYHEIMNLNQLSSDDVQVGQIIKIPVD